MKFRAEKEQKTNQIRANSPEERIKLWQEHFQNLLGQSINKVFDTLPIITGDFTMSELQDAIKATQNNKATGLDGIPAEDGLSERTTPRGLQ